MKSIKKYINIILVGIKVGYRGRSSFIMCTFSKQTFFQLNLSYPQYKGDGLLTVLMIVKSVIWKFGRKLPTETQGY